MYALSYLEMNTCCILLLLGVLNVHRKSANNSASARVFTMLVVFMIIYTAFDMVCGLVQNDLFAVPRWLIEALNVGFFWTSYMVSYFSFSYAEHEMNRPWLKDHRMRQLSCVPVLIMDILTVLTLKGRFFFYFDEQDNYIKGPFYVVMLLGAYGYIIAIAVDMIYLSRKSQYRSQRKKLRTLSSFVILPLLAGTAQAMFTGVSLLCFGGTVTILQVFLDLQETRITIDPLTQTNNRSHLTQVLESSMADEEKPVCFIMMDLDHFKSINDRYGHLEGDSALTEFARLLRQVCSSYAGILARYGGDEFAVVLFPHSAEEAETCAELFSTDLENTLREYNVQSQKPYPLRVSIGWAARSESCNTIADLIAAADKAMYQAKNQKRTGASK